MSGQQAEAASPVAEFFRLAAVAAKAAEAVRAYAINTLDPASVDAFRALDGAQADAGMNLVRHVMAHGDRLMVSLEGHRGVPPGTVIVDDTEAAPGN